MSHNANPYDQSAQPEMRPERLKPDPAYVADLIGVLLPQPGGLRRWSVMRAIRARREKANQAHSPQIRRQGRARVPRLLCGRSAFSASRQRPRLFYRPKDKAGEVWAVYADKARAWLNSELSAHV